MTDRMDCQSVLSHHFAIELKSDIMNRFLMGMFTWVYYSSLVKEHHVSVGQALQLIVSSLSINEQVELMNDLRKYLEGRGITV